MKMEKVITDNRKLNEIVKIIESFGAKYDPESDLSAFDQLQICEAVAEATPVKERYYQENERTNDNISVNGMVNDIGKRKANFELTQRKLELIKQLKTFNYRTPPILIAPILEEFFKEWPSISTHWSFMAQAYTPKTIKSVLNRIVNLHGSGYLIDNPPALFTLIIQKRPKRKTNTAINDIRKQQGGENK